MGQNVPIICFSSLAVKCLMSTWNSFWYHLCSLLYPVCIDKYSKYTGNEYCKNVILRSRVRLENHTSTITLHSIFTVSKHLYNFVSLSVILIQCLTLAVEYYYSSIISCISYCLFPYGHQFKFQISWYVLLINYQIIPYISCSKAYIYICIYNQKREKL